MRFSAVTTYVDSEADGFPEAVRAAFTLQSLLQNPLVGEAVLVDNNPNPKSPIKSFCADFGPRCRYVEFPAPAGNMPAKNEAVRQARCEYFVCVDSHVLLAPGCLEAVQAFYREKGFDCPDLVQGPMQASSGGIYGTHFNDQWRGDAWGTWGRCWQAPSGALFSVVEEPDHSARYVRVGEGVWDASPVSHAAMGLPEPGKYPGHEAGLLYAGARPYLDAPFQIAGNGMGFFAGRASDWLPFHPDARGFGAEEMTTGCRYRRAGCNIWCVPGAVWWHHFWKPKNPTYRLTVWDKVRNYVLDFKSTGMDLKPVKDHFVPHRMPEAEWEQVLAGKQWPDAGPAVAARPPDLLPDPPPAPARGETAPTPVLAPPLEPEATALLAEFVNKLDAGAVAVEAVSYGPGAAPTLAQGAGVSLVLSMSPVPMNSPLPGGVPHAPAPLSLEEPNLPETGCDFLYVDAFPYETANERVVKFLNRAAYRSSRFLAVRGTQVPPRPKKPGEKDNHLNALGALRTFAKTHPEWSTIAICNEGVGLTVMGRLDADKKQPPGTLIKAMNFGKALAKYAATGERTGEAEQSRRLEICVLCPERYNDLCGICGCPLVKKAAWSGEACPAKPPKW